MRGLEVRNLYKKIYHAHFGLTCSGANPFETFCTFLSLDTRLGWNDLKVVVVLLLHDFDFKCLRRLDDTAPRWWYFRAAAPGGGSTYPYINILIASEGNGLHRC